MLLKRLQRRRGGLTDAEVISMVEDKSWFKRATQPGGDKYKGKHTLLTRSSGVDNKEYLYPTIREQNEKTTLYLKEIIEKNKPQQSLKKLVI